MANQPIRVLLRWHFGLPSRQASEEETAQAREAVRQTIQEWKSSGVKLVGTFGGYGNGTGEYAHYAILEVDSLDVVNEMNNALYGGNSSRFYEK